MFFLVSVFLLAAVKRFGVSLMRDFFKGSLDSGNTQWKAWTNHSAFWRHYFGHHCFGVLTMMCLVLFFLKLFWKPIFISQVFSSWKVWTIVLICETSFNLRQCRAPATYITDTEYPGYMWLTDVISWLWVSIAVQSQQLWCKVMFRC